MHAPEWDGEVSTDTSVVLSASQTVRQAAMLTLLNMQVQSSVYGDDDQQLSYTPRSPVKPVQSPARPQKEVCNKVVTQIVPELDTISSTYHVLLQNVAVAAAAVEAALASKPALTVAQPLVPVQAVASRPATAADHASYYLQVALLSLTCLCLRDMLLSLPDSGTCCNSIC